jgi:ribosomal-protein-alanine N-acetyltransferase
LLGFCSFGADARVPGGDYSAEAADIGLGLRPERTGRRLSRRVIPAVLEFARDNFHPRHFRVTIAAFNLRAQKAWSAAGFRKSAEFASKADGKKFYIYLRDIDREPDGPEDP